MFPETTFKYQTISIKYYNGKFRVWRINEYISHLLGINITYKLTCLTCIHNNPHKFLADNKMIAQFYGIYSES